MQPANPTTPLDVIADKPRLDHVDETLGRKMGRDAQRVSRGELDEEVFFDRYHDEVVDAFGFDHRRTGGDSDK